MCRWKEGESLTGLCRNNKMNGEVEFTSKGNTNT